MRAALSPGWQWMVAVRMSRPARRSLHLVVVWHGRQVPFRYVPATVTRQTFLSRLPPAVRLKLKIPSPNLHFPHENHSKILLFLSFSLRPTPVSRCHHHDPSDGPPGAFSLHRLRHSIPSQHLNSLGGPPFNPAISCQHQRLATNTCDFYSSLFDRPTIPCRKISSFADLQYWNYSTGSRVAASLSRCHVSLTLCA